MNQSQESALEEFLLRLAPELAREWVGASALEIERIEAIVGRPLPRFYYWFLSRMGGSTGRLNHPDIDMSASMIVSAYELGLVLPDSRHLLIARESDDIVPIHRFYDLDVPSRDDALVLSQPAEGGGIHEEFETLRESLAWHAMLRFRVVRAPQCCSGEFSAELPGVIAQLAPVLENMGFKQPIATGDLCGIFEREDAWMTCWNQPGDEPLQSTFFRLGGRNVEGLRSILGTIEYNSFLDVAVKEWKPSL